MDEIAVLIPCFNEEITVGKVVRDFKKTLPQATVYVYDNNSTDKTVEKAKEAGAIVRHEYQQGKGNVVRRMFQEVEAQCYILVDADDTYPASEAAKMTERVLKYHADMVVGDRLSSTYFKVNKRRFHNSGNRFMRLAVQKLFGGKVRDVLETRDSGMDAKVQAKQVEKFIEEKVDCILINAVDWKKIGSSLEKAKKAGIPVIAVDALIYNRSFVDGTVVSNNYQAGEQCAKDLMKRRKKGKILFLVQSENKSAIDRIKGFKETLEKAGWKYENVGELECQGQLELSQPLVEKVLNKTKDIDVVMALNDPSAMGAMAALDAEHMLSDVLVYGADGSPEAKTMIYENKMAATSAQSPRTTGKKTVEMLYKILDGKKTEKQCIVPVSLITKDNINDYSLSGWQ